MWIESTNFFISLRPYSFMFKSNYHIFNKNNTSSFFTLIINIQIQRFYKKYIIANKKLFDCMNKTCNFSRNHILAKKNVNKCHIKSFNFKSFIVNKKA